MSLGATHRPLRDVVCDAIREQIVGGRHEPGTRRIEDHLANELGVSRSPVREALRVLEVEGYVDMIPRKGVVVATLSLDEAAEIFEVRAPRSNRWPLVSPPAKRPMSPPAASTGSSAERGTCACSARCRRLGPTQYRVPRAGARSRR